MEQLLDECQSYGTLRSALRCDLVSQHGFSNPDAGEILNWFNPAKPEYLEHVDEWQKWLCCACTTYQPPAALRYSKNMFGFYDITKIAPHQVEAIHQVAKLFYKWHGNPRRETNMDEVKQRLRRALPITLDEFEIEAIRQCLIGIEPIDLNSVVGRFGPGATYEGFDAYMKWKRKGLIPDVPPSLYRCSVRDDRMFQAFGPGITKIAEVPKSIKSNRIVSSEPAMYMYAQLAVNDALVRQLHALFPGHISLYDQTQHNRALKFRGACSIDLSDASDHVSCALVQAVLPQLWPVLAKVRSTFSQFPDGELVSLETFAPMGSGVCFSILTAVVTGILEYASRVIHREKHVATWYHVYGDDIIVPVEMYDFVCTLLARAGLVVNKAKSCCTLVYRESCGVEYLYDSDITPAYIRDPLDTVDAAKIEQVVGKLSRRLFLKTAEVVSNLSDAITDVRWNENLQRQEVRVRVTSARKKVLSLDGWDGLNRWFSLHTMAPKPGEKEPQGVASEVWTKPAWRYRASWDYPYLTTWLVTRRSPLTRDATT